MKIGDRISITSTDADTITVRSGKVGDIRKHGIDGWTFKSERGIVLGVQQRPHSLITIRIAELVKDETPLENYDALERLIARRSPTKIGPEF